MKKVLTILCLLTSCLTAPGGNASVTDTTHIHHTERDLVISHGKVTLPATLCLPHDTTTGRRVPLVVMVHGSGPCDRNETIGPNTPFRDMAHALARAGIASLRYDKRTFVYGAQVAQVGGADTYDTEVVHDAIQAIVVGRSLSQVDSTHIFVMGHSLGGALVPRIILHSPVPIAGGVLWSAPARPLDVLLREQLRHIASQSGQSPMAADQAYAQIIQQLPQPYLDFARTHRPIDEAGQTSVPLLIIGGGHDYQVPSADYLMWRVGLVHRPSTEYLWIEDGDHLLRTLPRMARPEDYMQRHPMSEEGIKGIIHFLQKHSAKQDEA